MGSYVQASVVSRLMSNARPPNHTPTAISDTTIFRFHIAIMRRTMIREANAQDAKPNVCDVKVSFNQEGDQYCTLAKKGIMTDSQEILGPSMTMNKQMKASKPV